MPRNSENKYTSVASICRDAPAKIGVPEAVIHQHLLSAIEENRIRMRAVVQTSTGTAAVANAFDKHPPVGAEAQFIDRTFFMNHWIMRLNLPTEKFLDNSGLCDDNSRIFIVKDTLVGGRSVEDVRFSLVLNSVKLLNADVDKVMQSIAWPGLAAPADVSGNARKWGAIIAACVLLERRGWLSSPQCTTSSLTDKLLQQFPDFDRRAIEPLAAIVVARVRN